MQLNILNFKQLLSKSNLKHFHSNINEKNLEQIKSIFGPNYSLAKAIRAHYSEDESFHMFVTKIS